MTLKIIFQNCSYKLLRLRKNMNIFMVWILLYFINSQTNKCTRSLGNGLSQSRYAKWRKGFGESPIAYGGVGFHTLMKCHAHTGNPINAATKTEGVLEGWFFFGVDTLLKYCSIRIIGMKITSSSKMIHFFLAKTERYGISFMNLGSPR